MSNTQIIVEPCSQILVILCEEDYAIAPQVGSLRTAEATRAGRLGRAGCQTNNLEQDINAAAAEVAFAHAMVVPPLLSVTPDNGPDVAGFHVRSTHSPNGRLIIRPGDSEDNRYVLLIGQGLD